MEGWIKLYRKLIDWEWFDKSEMVHLFVYFTLKANHKAKKWREISIAPGQLVTTLPTISKETGISIQTIRTCLYRLESTGVITNESTNQYRIITVCKYESYQDTNAVDNSQYNRQPTGNQQTGNSHNNNEENILPAYAHTRENETDLENCYAALSNNAIWFEPFCMNNRLTPEQFRQYLKCFFIELQNRGETTKSEKDAKHHFASWFNLNKNKLNGTDQKLSKEDKARKLFDEYEAVRGGQRPFSNDEVLPDL